ncbi:MAG: hypothetical protein QOF45_1119 [Gaiellaceae bacterium]|jgi:hypothetical protein|nr:hypothetical protein [Gaiellaceae bacterium]
MTEDRELTREELEQQKGKNLPAREVMSTVSANPGLIAIPEDPTTIEDIRLPEDNPVEPDRGPMP